MHNLIDSEKEALANYQAITETWDSEQAINLLQRHNWDVTQASKEFFSAGSPVNPVRQPQQNPQNSNWNKKISSFFASIWKTIVPGSIRGDTSNAAEDFSLKLQASCSPELRFSNLLFAELLQAAFGSNKVVFLYIHQYSFEYPQELFSNLRIVQLLNKEFLYWGVESESNEGQMLKAQLRIENFPCFVVLKVEVLNKPVVLKRHEGYLDKRFVIRMLEDYCVHLDQQILVERRLREAQEEEFLQAEALVHQKKELENARKLLAEEKMREKSKRVQDFIQKIGPEPDTSQDSVLVSFKLSTGKRVIRRFLRIEKIKIFFEFLETQEIEAEEILTGFPLEVLADKEVLIKDAGILDQSVVHVRERS